MSGAWLDGELLALDFETTGVVPTRDVPVSYALVRAASQQVLSVQSSLVNPGRQIPAGAVAIHGITSERAAAEGVRLERAIRLVGEAVLAAARAGVPLVGMNLAFDLSILDHQLRALDGAGLAERGWQGPIIDVLVLDRHLDQFRKGPRRLEQLCRHYGVVPTSAHDAGADAAAALGVLFALGARFPILSSLDPVALTTAQIEWHRAWVARNAAWHISQGRRPHDHDGEDWPIAGAVCDPPPKR